MTSVNYLREMPFYGLSDFQLIWENETYKQEILAKMTNNGFIDFIKNSWAYSEENVDLQQYKYFDMDEYSYLLNKKHQLNIIHLNCRMLSHNKGKIMSFLNSLDADLIDIILLSEIGKEGHRYLSMVFPNHDYEIDIPENNSYGGVAIVAKKEFNMMIKSNFKIIKECNCTRCQVENV